MIAHVAVIFRERDAGVDGGFARRNGHVGCIGNQNGAVGQGLTGFRVDQIAELFEHLCHFVAALAAADIDDDVGVAPFCQLMLGHRFSGSKSARHRCGAALGDGEQRIDYALAGNQRALDGQALRNRARRTNRPFLRQRKRMFRSFFVTKHDNRIKNLVVAVGRSRHHLARQRRGHHGAVLNH